MTDFWESYEELNRIVEAGKIQDALSMIETHEAIFDQDPGLIAVVKSRCYRQLGNMQQAYEALLPFASDDKTNVWVHYSMGSAAFAVGRVDETYLAFQRFHKKLGWEESTRNGYTFTHDYFSPNIDNWSRWFREHIRQSPISCLEIGSWQGGSTTWMIDKVLTKRPGSSMVCVDSFGGSSEHSNFINAVNIESIFDSNIERTKHQNLIEKKKGLSQDVLRMLDGRFDFIYVDGAHEAKYVIQDAFLSWRMLNKNGFLLFDDYPFSFADEPAQNTAVAVDQFIRWHKSEIEVVEKGRQLLLRRL